LYRLPRWHWVSNCSRDLGTLRTDGPKSQEHGLRKMCIVLRPQFLTSKVPQFVPVPSQRSAVMLHQSCTTLGSTTVRTIGLCLCLCLCLCLQTSHSGRGQISKNFNLEATWRQVDIFTGQLFRKWPTKMASVQINNLDIRALLHENIKSCTFSCY
jgi:hypothetical protein